MTAPRPAAFFLVLLATGLPLHADIAWDTLGPSNTYHSSTGGTVRGPNHTQGPFWTGVQFTAQASGAISEVDIALVISTVTGLDNLYSAEIWSDDGNVMGAMLSDLGMFQGHTNGAPPANLTGNNFNLDAGTTYWMVVKGHGTSSGAWRRSLLSDPGLRSFTSNLGASWSYFTADPRYAFRIVVEPNTCYANCDGSTTAPILNVDDFTCFINEFAAAQALPHEQQVEHYANCDSSTTAPALNVDDFTCFINAFAAGCP